MVNHLQLHRPEERTLASQITVLPRYAFAGARLSEQEKKAVEEYLSKQRMDILEQPTPTPVVKPAQIQELLDSHAQWVRMLGFDVKNSMPDLSKIYFFSPDEFAKLAKRWGKQANWGGAQFEPSGEIVLPDLPSPAATLGNLGHEIIHAFSKVTLFVRRTADGVIHTVPYLYGYENVKQGVLKCLSEAVTEAANIEALDYLRKRGGPDYLTGTHIAYLGSTISLDMMLRETAGLLGRDVKEIKREIYKGYFASQPFALKIIEDAFGQGALKFLSTLPFDAKFSIDLGSNNKLNKITSAYDEGEEIEIFGVRLKKPLTAI